MGKLSVMNSIIQGHGHQIVKFTQFLLKILKCFPTE